MPYREVRDDILAYIERRREAQAGGPKFHGYRGSRGVHQLRSNPELQGCGGASYRFVVDEEAWVHPLGFGWEETFYADVAQVNASWGKGFCTGGG